MIILILLLAGSVLWCVWTINSFKAREMKISEARSGIEVALTKRHDVLEKLLEASQGYLRYEYSVYLRDISVRNGMTPAEIYNAETHMDALTEQILAEAEAYPVLKSSKVFRELQYGMEDTEQHLEAARRVYNSNVQRYNTAITKFPARLLAGRRRPVPFFYSKQGVHTDMKMTF